MNYLNGGYAMIKHNATQDELSKAYASNKPVIVYDENHKAHYAEILLINNEYYVRLMGEKVYKHNLTLSYYDDEDESHDISAVLYANTPNILNIDSVELYYEDIKFPKQTFHWNGNEIVAYEGKCHTSIEEMLFLCVDAQTQAIKQVYLDATINACIDVVE